MTCLISPIEWLPDAADREVATLAAVRLHDALDGVRPSLATVVLTAALADQGATLELTARRAFIEACIELLEASLGEGEADGRS